MNAREYALTSWKAAQGNKGAQRAMAVHFAALGNTDESEFWAAKANRDPAFTPENFRARKAGVFNRKAA